MSAARVLVASRDADYRRLAGVALARAGFSVYTVVARAERVERLLAHQRPDVLVLDTSDAGLARIDGFVATLAHPPAVVVVAGEADRAAGVTGRWSSTADLVDAVVHAAPRRARPALHLVGRDDPVSLSLGS